MQFVSLMMLRTRRLAWTLPLLCVVTAPPSAFAAVARDVAGPTAEPVSSPACTIESATDAWKIPVNAPGVPLTIVESYGAKLTPTISISPTAEYTLLTDVGSPTPAASRIFKIAGVKAGDKYAVTLGGTCTGGSNPAPQTLTVEYVGETATPLTMGTFAEAPEGLARITFDQAFLPHLQVATIDVLANGSPLGSYGPGGMFPGPEDNYGVRACVGNACASGDAHVRPLDLRASLICKAGRSSGKVRVALTARTRLIGSNTYLPDAEGEVHVDCSKATDEELGILPPSGTQGTGCSVRSVPVSSGTRSASVGLGVLALALALRLRRSRR